jgi:hypothetical protein
MKRAAALLVVTFAMFALAQRTYTQAGGPIPAGTQVQVRFIDALSSETAKSGDTFHGTLEQPIVVNGRTLYAKGADVTGRVVRSHPSGRLSDPGELDLVLTSISSGGRPWPINVEPLHLKGESHTKSNVTKIGGGAALGAIIGGIAGGGKGAAIGAGVGAAGGTGVAAATGKKDTRIESEAVLTWVTAEPPAMQSATSSPYANTAQRDLRSFDDPRGAAVPSEFSLRDRQSIRQCFSSTSNLPPGLAKRDQLPPGLERQVRRNGTLPPGLQKRVQPLPDVCSSGLPRLPVDWSRVVLGRRVLLLDPAQKVVDLMNLDSDE